MKRSSILFGSVALVLIAAFSVYAVENATWGKIKSTFTDEAPASLAKRAAPDEAPASLAKAAPSLRCTTEYFFVAGSVPNDPEGRVLGWQGPISGDIEGVIQWWMFLDGGPNDRSTGQVGHHAGGRFAIWDVDPLENPEEAVLLLAGSDEESTTVRHGKNSVWRGHGIVTDASPELELWIGRSMHEGGHFTWDPDTGLPDHGEGIFRIN